MSKQYEILEGLWSGTATLCSDTKCGRMVVNGAKYFIDTNVDTIYCHACGLCLRYERKKAEQRKRLNNAEQTEEYITKH